MKKILTYAGIISVLIIGIIAILWILGVGNFEELSETAFRIIGVIVVCVAMASAIITITKLNNHQEKTPEEKKE